MTQSILEQISPLVKIISEFKPNEQLGNYYLWYGDVADYLKQVDSNVKFDLVVTSPPYNIGKGYEERVELDEYIKWQQNIIRAISHHVSDKGSICWQVGNYVENGSIWPLDIELAPIFRDLGYRLRNRIVWHFGHGLHTKKRFSGRYEVVLWFTKSDNYTFNLDAVRIPSKYPGKKAFKGPNAGKYSGNPQGKNPEDVWEIPNVKSNHVEKTVHPCQFPVGLIERLVLSLTNPGDLVFDPFVGVGSAGVGAALHNRRFYGCDISLDYLEIGQNRITDALVGKAKYRPHDKPIYDYKKSKLSRKPEDFDQLEIGNLGKK